MSFPEGFKWSAQEGRPVYSPEKKGTFLYVDKRGQIATRYVRLLTLGRYEIALTWIPRGQPPAWRWSHGFDDWEWLPNMGCWFHEGNSPGDFFCLGDRMFHQAHGATREDVVWHGSYVDNWHGGIQTKDFTTALEWLHEARGIDHQSW